MITNKKSSLPNLDELYKSIDNSFDVENTKVRILVLGPNLDGDGNGSVFRRYIIQKCKVDKFIVVFAEHTEIQEQYLKILGPIYDLCKMEFHLAVEKDKNNGYDLIDGIIILQDSSGSFVELGMFVMEDSIHSKMLILFNKEYETTITDSFIGKGAKLAFDNGRAITKIVDYADLENSWSEVSKFIKSIKASKLWRMFRRRISSHV